MKIVDLQTELVDYLAQLSPEQLESATAVLRKIVDDIDATGVVDALPHWTDAELERAVVKVFGHPVKRVEHDYSVTHAYWDWDGHETLWSLGREPKGWVGLAVGAPDTHLSASVAAHRLGLVHPSSV
jgi:hypothetical protein